jgi:large subunit ribosomal protein L22
MEVKVKKRYLKTSPNKIRPILKLIRRKKAQYVVDSLRFSNKGFATDIVKLIISGMAAAKERDIEEDRLFVKTMTCDDASRLKRHRYGSRGRVVGIVKRSSHLFLTLSDQGDAGDLEKDQITNKENKDTLSNSPKSKD